MSKIISSCSRNASLTAVLEQFCSNFLGTVCVCRVLNCFSGAATIRADKLHLSPGSCSIKWLTAAIHSTSISTQILTITLIS